MSLTLCSRQVGSSGSSRLSCAVGSLHEVLASFANMVQTKAHSSREVLGGSQTADLLQTVEQTPPLVF